MPTRYPGIVLVEVIVISLDNKAGLATHGIHGSGSDLRTDVSL
jgi:hypothetical protein